MRAEPEDVPVALTLTSQRGSENKEGANGFDQEVAFEGILTLEQVHHLQRRSSILRQLRRVLDQGLVGEWPKSLSKFKRHHRAMMVHNGVLAHTGPSRVVPVVTFQVLIEVTLQLHRALAHIGRQKLIEEVKRHLWHRSLSKVAGDVAASCDTCQRMKVSSVIHPPIYRVSETIPFQLVTMDLLALPRSGGCSACLVVVDHCSKWLCAVPLTNKTSLTVAAALEHRVLPCLLRCPVRVLTDNGPEFRGEPVNDLLNRYGVEHVYTTPNRPPSNGLVERTNRTLQEMLRLLGNSSEWSRTLPRVVMTYNQTYHSTLSCSPAEFLLKKQHDEEVSARISTDVQSKWREGHPSFGSFRVGDKVLKKKVVIGNTTEAKFAERFGGPWKVTKVNSNGVTYQIQHWMTKEIIRAHHGQLKKLVEVPGYLRKHPAYEEQVLNDSGESDQGAMSGDGWKCRDSSDDLDRELAESSQVGPLFDWSEDDSSEASFHGWDIEERSLSTSSEAESENSSRLDNLIAEDIPRRYHIEDNPLLMACPEKCPGDSSVSFCNEQDNESLSPVARRDRYASWSSPVLQTSVRHPAGMLVAGDEELWDLTELQSSGAGDRHLQRAVEACTRILEIGLDSRNKGATGDSGSAVDSFVGFESPHTVGSPVREKLVQLQSLVTAMSSDLHRRRGRLEASDVGSSGGESSGARSSPQHIVTRSRRRAASLPNVQEGTLEYRLGRLRKMVGE